MRTSPITPGVGRVLCESSYIACVIAFTIWIHIDGYYFVSHFSRFFPTLPVLKVQVKVSFFCFWFIFILDFWFVKKMGIDVILLLVEMIA